MTDARVKFSLALAGGLTLAVPLTAKFEGYEGFAYKDIVGVWTYGYGQTGPDVKQGSYISESNARVLLSKTLEAYGQEGIKCLDGVAVTNKEAAAYLSLMYNIGVSAFCKSTIVKLLKDRQYDAACKGIMAFNKVKKSVKGSNVKKLVAVKGLTNRRKAEYELCIS